MSNYFLGNPVLELNAKSYLSYVKSMTPSWVNSQHLAEKFCLKCSNNVANLVVTLLSNQLLVDGKYVRIICFKCMPVYIIIMPYLLMRSDPVWGLERR
jgi:hypothetical protein